MLDAEAQQARVRIVQGDLRAGGETRRLSPSCPHTMCPMAHPAGLRHRTQSGASVDADCGVKRSWRRKARKSGLLPDSSSPEPNTCLTAEASAPDAFPKRAGAFSTPRSLLLRRLRPKHAASASERLRSPSGSAEANWPHQHARSSAAEGVSPRKMRRRRCDPAAPPKRRVQHETRCGRIAWSPVETLAAPLCIRRVVSQRRPPADGDGSPKQAASPRPLGSGRPQSGATGICAARRGPPPFAPPPATAGRAHAPMRGQPGRPAALRARPVT